MTINPATQPANVGNIMQDMFSKMVQPTEIATSKPLNSGTNQQPPVTIETPTPQPQQDFKPEPKAQPKQDAKAPEPIKPIDTSPPPREDLKLKEPQKQEVKIGDKVDTNFFTEDVDAIEEPNVQEPAVDEEPDMSDVPESPAAENFKKMREALKNDRKALKALEREAKTLKAENEKWLKGEKIPDVLTAKDTRIQELEKLEVMVNGKLSTEYNELVVKPAVATKDEFTKLAEGYGVEENIREALVRKIVETENEKERNALITRYFPDAIGATKAKELVTRMHELGNLAIEMEKKPLETQQSLQAKYQEKVKVEDEKRAGIFENVSKIAWNNAIEKTSQEEIYKDLILDPSNPEHNKVAEKNQHRAAIQYGALIKELYRNGLKTLPDKIAEGIARSVLLGIGGVEAFRQLNKVQTELQEIKQSSSVQTTYFRPSPNGNGHSAPANRQPDAGPRTPEEAAKRASASLSK